MVYDGCGHRYQAWMDKKENDLIARREAALEGPTPPRGFSISEVRNAAQQVIQEDDVFELMDKLALEVRRILGCVYVLACGVSEAGVACGVSEAGLGLWCV